MCTLNFSGTIEKEQAAWYDCVEKWCKVEGSATCSWENTVILFPSKFREALGDRFVITRSLDPCLCIYTMEDWEKFVSRLNSLPYNVKKQRQLVEPRILGREYVQR